MLYDTENLDIMLGGNSLDGEESVYSNPVRRPVSPSYENLLNQNDQSHSNSREAEIINCAQGGHSAIEADSASEFNRISGELNQKFSQEMRDFMSSVSSKFQRAINEAINDQILPQIQTFLRSGHEQMSERRREDLAKRQGCSSEEALNRRFRSSSRDECNRDSSRDEVSNNPCDSLIHGSRWWR